MWSFRHDWRMQLIADDEKFLVFLVEGPRPPRYSPDSKRKFGHFWIPCRRVVLRGVGTKIAEGRPCARKGAFHHPLLLTYGSALSQKQM